MIDGANYKKVLEVTSKAEHMGLIIVPPYFKETIIEPASRNEVFKVEVSELRYPTIRHRVVHQGNFVSVETFITGAYFLHESLCDLGIITDDNVLSAAQQFILMETIRNSGQ